MTHIVSYTVNIPKYDAIIPAIIGNFEFTILCPPTITSSLLVTGIQSLVDYDVASQKPLSLDPPEVYLTPAKCFSVATYYVIDKLTSEQPEYITMSDSSIEILTNDRNLLWNESGNKID